MPLLFIILSFCFLDFIPCEKSVAIITYRVANMNPWDPDTIKSGIVGGEEAVIYMSQSLAKLGYKVSVFGNAPENSRYSAEASNPCFLPDQPEKGAKFDIVISWRMPELAAYFRQYAPRVYLWPHDVLEGARSLTVDQVTGFDDVLWLSEWQRAQWCSVHAAFARYKNIYGNGIEPGQFQPVEERENPYSCIYGSNYARGLEILLNIWPAVKVSYPLATLDIYYGWEHWGLLSKEKEARMRQQIVDFAPLGVKEHGLVSHEELNRAYARTSFWTYPCIMPETFCITALRAQLSGCFPVINEGSALSETVRFGYKSNDPNEYLSLLLNAMERAQSISLTTRKSIGEFVLNEFTWDKVAAKWKDQFDAPIKVSYQRLTPSIQKSKEGYTLIFPVKFSDGIKSYVCHCNRNLKELAREEKNGKVKPEASECWAQDHLHDFSRFRAAAGPINFDDGYLMLVHEEVETDRHFDYHRFVYLNKQFQITQTSNLFTFKHQGIERCTSMVMDYAGEKFIFPVNFEESEFGFCYVDLETVRSMLKTLP